MKKFLLLILLIIIFSCSSSQILRPEKRCAKILKNDYSEIVVDKYTSIIDNDTITLNEVKYKCVFTSTYIKKIMFDKYGKWTRTHYPNNQKHPILIWENIKLFDNAETTFTIAALGAENHQTIYTSVMVFDNDFNDSFIENSVYKDDLITFFGQLIKMNNDNKREFYDAYKVLF